MIQPSTEIKRKLKTIRMKSNATAADALEKTNSEEAFDETGASNLM